jgi:hypothetical protein
MDDGPNVCLVDAEAESRSGHYQVDITRFEAFKDLLTPYRSRIAMKSSRSFETIGLESLMKFPCPIRR